VVKCTHPPADTVTNWRDFEIVFQPSMRIFLMQCKHFFTVLCAACSTVLLITVVPEAQPLDGWSLVWSDEFDSTALDGSKWLLELSEGDHGMSAYTSRPQNLAVSNGCLVLQAQKETYGGKPYTSTQVSSRGKAFWKYGRFDIRAKLPVGRGMWPAIWMMPNKRIYGTWPRNGEIDIMENLGDKMNLFYSTLHYSTIHDSKQGTCTTPGATTLSDSFHVYTMIWDTTSFAFYFDSVHNYWNCDDWKPDSLSFPKPFDQDFFMLFDLAVGGEWGGPPDSTTLFPQKMLVDWVRVYKRNNNAQVIRRNEPAMLQHGQVNIKSSWIDVQLPSETFTGFTLHDMAGREVIRFNGGNSTNGRVRFHVPSSLQPGCYVWKLATDRQATAGSIVVE
jgi:beta-glucanase (GH16 family)